MSDRPDPNPLVEARKQAEDALEVLISDTKDWVEPLRRYCVHYKFLEPPCRDKGCAPCRAANALEAQEKGIEQLETKYHQEIERWQNERGAKLAVEKENRALRSNYERALDKIGSLEESQHDLCGKLEKARGYILSTECRNIDHHLYRHLCSRCVALRALDGGGEGEEKSFGACRDCGTGLNEGEAKTFTVCDSCWDKHWHPALDGDAVEEEPSE